MRSDSGERRYVCGVGMGLVEFWGEGGGGMGEGYEGTGVVLGG